MVLFFIGCVVGVLSTVIAGIFILLAGLASFSPWR